jgi:hypothetical protein
VDVRTAARRAFELFGQVFGARLERFEDRAGSELGAEAPADHGADRAHGEQGLVSV